MHTFSRNLLKLLFIAAAAYAMYKELQFVAIAAFVGVLITFEWFVIRQIVYSILPVITSAKRAKLSGFELELRDPTGQLSKELSTQPTWVRYIVSELQPKNVGVLFLLADKGKYKFPSALKDSLGPLRNAGLIEHNATSLRESETVWLSTLGQDLFSRLQGTTLAKTLELVEISEP